MVTLFDTGCFVIDGVHIGGNVVWIDMACHFLSMEARKGAAVWRLKALASDR